MPIAAPRSQPLCSIYTDDLLALETHSHNTSSMASPTTFRHQKGPPLPDRPPQSRCIGSQAGQDLSAQPHRCLLFCLGSGPPCHPSRQCTGRYSLVVHLARVLERGVSLLPAPQPSQSNLSNASVAWGCGATWSGHWFQDSWPPSWASLPITPKEQVPIILAVALWGHL